MKKIKKMRNRNAILLISTAVVLAVAAFFYIWVNGQTYQLRGMLIENDENIEVRFSAEGIVECVDISPDNNLITFKSLSPGETDVEIIYNDCGSTSIVMRVNQLGIIFCNGSDFKGLEGIIGAAIIFCAVLMATMVTSYIKQSKISIFSYKNIFYLGMALFSLNLIITHFMMCMRSDCTLSVEDMTTFAVVDMTISSTLMFVFLSTPLIIIIAVALSTSNISLVRHEGFRPANLLGIIFSVFIIVGVFLTLFSSRILDALFAPAEGVNVTLKQIETMVSIFVCVTLCYIENLLFGAIVCGVKAARHEPEYDKDYIIILGCGIAKDGSLLPLLRGRVDRAIEFYKSQKAVTGKSAVFIPSGGQGPDEIMSESEAMRNYLVANGIPEDEIIMENKSTTTYENMLFSKRVIDSIEPNSKVAFSTTNYHVFRSGIFAESLGLHAEGMGSKTKWYFWPNAFLRELVGVIVSKIKINILVLLLIAVFAAVWALVF